MQCTASTRRKKQLEGPKEITSDESSQDRNEHVENVMKEISSPSKEVIDDAAHKPEEVPRTLRPFLQSPTHRLY